MIQITEDNISNIFDVVDACNFYDIDRPIKLYEKRTNTIIDTGLDYNEIYRQYFGGSGKFGQIFMKVKSFNERVVILVSIDKDFKSCDIFETKFTLNSLNDEYKNLNCPYIINIEGRDALYIDPARLPAIDQRDFYDSIYDTRPKRKGNHKVVDKTGEQSLISTITGLLPDKFTAYKNADYTRVLWMVADDDSIETIMISDNNLDKTITVKLK